MATNTAEIIANTVFGLIGFYEDSRTWTNVNPIGRLRQLDKILATDLNTLTLLFLSAAIIYFALQIIEKNHDVKCHQIVNRLNGKRKLLANKSIFFALNYVYCGLVLTFL